MKHRVTRRIKKELDERFSDRYFAAVKAVLDSTLPFVLLLVTLLVVFEFGVQVTSQIQGWINIANWAVIGYFVARLVVDFKLSDPGEPFLRRHWLDILMVLPLFSVAREVKVMKLLEESQLITLFNEEGLIATSALQNTQVAAKLTRIVRIIKRSLSF